MRRPLRLQVGWEKPAEGNPDEAGHAGRFATCNVVRLSLVQQGARSSPHALTDSTWVDNVLECGRNAGTAGLIQGGENGCCPGLSANLGDG